MSMSFAPATMTPEAAIAGARWRKIGLYFFGNLVAGWDERKSVLIIKNSCPAYFTNEGGAFGTIRF